MSSEAPTAVLTVVGSGTLVPDGRRGSPAHHLRTDVSSILLDCGPGTVHGMARLGIDWESLTHVVITHFHNDHFGDLPALLVALKHGRTAPRSEPLVLAGPPDFRELLGALAEAHGDYVSTQDFAVTPVEVGPRGVFSDRRGGFEMRSWPTPHTPESIALLVKGPWGSLGYTGDGGPSDGVASLFRGVSVLVSECSWPDPPEGDTHLTPSGVAALAAEASPELLVVTHVMPPETPIRAVSRISEGYAGRVVAGEDGLRVRIAPDDVTVDPPAGGL